MFAAPKVSAVGCIVIPTNSWSWPQLGSPARQPSANATENNLYSFQLMTSPDGASVDVPWRRGRQFIRTTLKKQDIRALRSRRDRELSSPNRFRHNAYKFFHIFFGCVEGTHPAHHRLLFIPNVKEISLLNSCNRRTRDRGKYSIGFDFVDNSHLCDF